jgi:hypothetical protein
MKLFITFLLTAISFAQVPAPYRNDGPALLPNPQLTPGVPDPALTKELICNGKWRTGSVRNVPPELAMRVYQEYGMHDKHSGPCAATIHKGANGKSRTVYCEVDHLVSLQLAGRNDLANLWPQSYKFPGAYEKDAVEGWLHRQVCLGKITLEDAQKQIATDWYKVWLAMPKKKGKP